MSTTPMPEEFGGLTPHLVVTDAAAAVIFYQQAFGADELDRRHGPDGRVWHCELLVAGGRLLLMEEFPDMAVVSPHTLGGTPVILHAYIDDVDAWFARAVAAGATPLMEPSDAFWGDRYGQVLDPFGHRWSLASRREDLSGEQVDERAADWSRAHGDPLSPAQARDRS